MPSSEKIYFGAPVAQLESLSQGRQKQENTTPSLHWYPRLNSKSKVGGGGSLWFGKIFRGHRPGSVTFPSSQVRFSRPESEQARQRRVQSYEFLQKKHAEEPWVHLHYYGMRVSQCSIWGKSPDAQQLLVSPLAHLVYGHFAMP